MAPTGSSFFERGRLDTDLLSGPLEFAVVRPATDEDGLPLIYLFHGAGGTTQTLINNRALIEDAWAKGMLPPCVVVTPSTGQSLPINHRDGSERWEDAFLGPLFDQVGRAYGASALYSRCALAGLSTGGAAALRMALKQPTAFAAVAALAPRIEAALRLTDLEPASGTWAEEQEFSSVYGSPPDEEYWAANNPASIVTRHAEEIRGSGLRIFLECGDADSFGLHRGAELLHRCLFDSGIDHEYHLIHGADHVGESLAARTLAALQFIGDVFDPPPPDHSVGVLRSLVSHRQEASL
ncbi:MAG TPA: alpha/beta hydrolase-fold protein [Acidimicrobiales bacterium]|nr:alpha/beta hydrolase-fold protein [Acidimicrobiales bacterium]